MPEEKKEINEVKAIVTAKEDFNLLLITIAAALTWKQMGHPLRALQEITYAEFLARKLGFKEKLKECEEIRQGILSQKAALKEATN